MHSGLQQGLVGLLAGLAGSGAGVGYFSKLSASRFQPSKHVGKQSGGGGGWWAAGGRGGICGGCTGGGAAGGKGCGTLAQAVTSQASISGSSRHAVGLVLGFTGDLLVALDPRLFEGAVVGLDAPGLGVGGGQGLGGLAAVCLLGGAQFGSLELRAVQAPGLHAGQGDQAQDDSQEGRLQAEDAALEQAQGWTQGAARCHRVPGVVVVVALAVVVWGWPSHVARSAARRLARPPQRLAGSRQSLP